VASKYKLVVVVEEVEVGHKLELERDRFSYNDGDRLGVVVELVEQAFLGVRVVLAFLGLLVLLGLRVVRVVRLVLVLLGLLVVLGLLEILEVRE